MAKKSPVKSLETARKRRNLMVRARIGSIQQFANKIREKFGKYIKSVVIFGSYARGDFTMGSDTDVLVLIDDTESNKAITDETKEKLHEKMQEMAQEVDKEIHIQLHTVTEFWEYMRNGDPLFFNYLRHGMAVYDIGFIKPMQRLLLGGAIKPSKEAIYKSIDGAKSYLVKVTSYMEWSVERLYRAVTWAANAYLMAAGMPPAEVPELVPVFKKYFAESKQLEEEHVATMDEIIKLHKQIEHGEFKGPQPEKVAELKARADKFVARMETGVKDFLDGKKRAQDLKDKIKTTPKVFWVYTGKDSRGYAWLFEKDIFVAIYEEKKLTTVLRGKIHEGKLQGFEPSDSKTLFADLEGSEFKPIITVGIITIIVEHLPDNLKGPFEKIGVEYPNKALVDLSAILLEKDKKGPEEPKV